MHHPPPLTSICFVSIWPSPSAALCSNCIWSVQNYTCHARHADRRSNCSTHANNTFSGTPTTTTTSTPDARLLSTQSPPPNLGTRADGQTVCSHTHMCIYIIPVVRHTHTTRTAERVYIHTYIMYESPNTLDPNNPLVLRAHIENPLLPTYHPTPLYRSGRCSYIMRAHMRVCLCDGATTTTILPVSLLSHDDAAVVVVVIVHARFEVYMTIFMPRRRRQRRRRRARLSRRPLLCVVRACAIVSHCS